MAEDDGGEIFRHPHGSFAFLSPTSRPGTPKRLGKNKEYPGPWNCNRKNNLTVTGKVEAWSGSGAFRVDEANSSGQ